MGWRASTIDPTRDVAAAVVLPAKIACAGSRGRLTAARASRSIAAMAEAPSITRAKRSARDERLAQALRENLRRRKEQARAREPKAVKPPGKAASGDEPPV
jgi:hypothetical protein